jgi:glycerol-3-phosphate cytidylyltransferase
LQKNLESRIITSFTRTEEGAYTVRKIITYGTFDLLHYGHINLLKRAKSLGDYLIVALSTDEFNWESKQKKCYFNYEQRKSLLEAIRYVDLVIPEKSWGQKRLDMKEYHIDEFVMGNDWEGKFDYLRDEGVKVTYLPRTPEVSTTQIKTDLFDQQYVTKQIHKVENSEGISASDTHSK